MAAAYENVRFPIWSTDAEPGGAAAALSDFLRLRLVHVSACTIDERWTFERMANPLWRIYCNLDAGASARMGKSRLRFAPGQVYIVPAWLQWGCECTGPVRHIHGYFDLPDLSREQVQARFGEIVPAESPDGRVAGQLLEVAGALMRPGTPDAAVLTRAYAAVYSALTAMFAERNVRLDAIAPAMPSRVAGLLPWIEEHLGEPLTSSRLARAACCSEAELRRRFRDELHTSPARWIRDRRLRYACDLLLGRPDKLDEVARKCGFSDRFHLSRSFTARFGVAPATWRSQQLRPMRPA